MSAQPKTYESAVERLEEIIARLDSNEAGLRETLDLCNEGKTLIEFAEKGEVPGRQIGDQWRFARQGLLDWLART